MPESVEMRLARLEAQVLRSGTYQDILWQNVEYVAAESNVVIYDVWQSGADYEVGGKCIYLGNLYECIQAHKSQDDWTPALTPALWKRKGGAAQDDYPDWAQPYGASDAYAKGDKVSHKGGHWISDIDANVWEPGVYGWMEVA